jgi:hypothetical protein
VYELSISIAISQLIASSNQDGNQDGFQSSFNFVSYRSILVSSQHGTNDTDSIISGNKMFSGCHRSL